MKVLEVKNNLVKIAYDVKDNLILSGFVIIEDENTPYVAQVVNLKADVTTNFAIVKLLFTFNDEGILKNYNGSIPSVKAVVSKLPSNELLDILPVENPLKLGKLAQQEFTLNVDKSIFKNNLVICSNSQENTNVLLDNFLRQLEPYGQKTVIFDINGEFDWEKKVYFGEDFKLPLNYDTINYIYEHELDDVDATSRAIIQDIFIELQEYTKTLPEGFIPFDSFFSVVDQQYKETGITQLVLLKNKLLKYRDTEVFAQNLKDVLNLSIAIEKTDTVVIDISSLSPKLQNEVISYTYDVMSKVNASIFSFVKAENGTVTKKLLKKIINLRNNISSTIICGHEFKYLPELKQTAENMILFTPQTLQHDFASYNTFLNKLNADEYIVFGNLTQHIPLIVQLEKIDVEKPSDEQKNEQKVTETIPMPSIPVKNEQEEEVNKEQTTGVEENKTEEINIPTVQPTFEEVLPVTEEELHEEIEIQPEPIIDEPIIDEIQEVHEEDTEAATLDNILLEEVQPENIQQEASQTIQEVDLQQEPQEEPEFIQEQEELETLAAPQIDISEEPSVETNLNITPTIDEEIINNEPIIEQIEEPDIDEPSVEIIDSSQDLASELPLVEDETNEIEITEEPEIVNLTEVSELESDELTEDDLNLIDDLSSQEPELDENVSTDVLIDAVNKAAARFEQIPLEEDTEKVPLPEPDFINEEEQVPVVPIYPASDTDITDVPYFEAGDEVIHPKYGKGVVEKMIKYGNKTLYSVSFHNLGIGRRLLDPAMTELKKL